MGYLDQRIVAAAAVTSAAALIAAVSAGAVAVLPAAAGHGAAVTAVGHNSGSVLDLSVRASAGPAAADGPLLLKLLG